MASGDAYSEERRLLATVLRAEADAVAALVERLGPDTHRAVDIIEACATEGGSVLVTGLGKSGIVGKKISATLASLGVPSHDVHPTEAAHGDLGRFGRKDCLLALSHSGETEEVVALAAILRQDGIPVISITGGDGSSSLARLSTVALTIGEVREAGAEFALAPTCSTTATLALGDALALAVAHRRSFNAEDFARRHPGGSLGGLLRPVLDVLRFTAGKNLPIVREEVALREAMRAAERLGRRPGALVIVNDSGKLTGIFTDGDLRRLILRAPEELDRPIGQLMTRNPRSLPGTALVRDAVRLIREFRQDEVPVVDPEGRPIGLLDVQDLIALRLVKD